MRITILQNFVHQQTLGRFRLFVTADDGPLHADLRPPVIDALLATSSSDRTPAEVQRLRDYFLSITPDLKRHNEAIHKLRDTRPRLATTFVFQERSASHRRPTHIHVRGEYQRRGARVTPGVPRILHPLVGDEPRDRLALARWLVDRRNPLLGRVMVNHVWQCLFGRGLVATPENFGLLGARPSHPQLLDWLAVEFQRRESLKSLHRQLMMSAVYQQASQQRPELVKRDPENRLLARRSRLRVDAETVRDIALHASGLLVGTLGGPSVFPPQPEEAGTTFGPFRWKNSTGSARYRRGLYTFRKRGGPYAAFTTFDAPPPNTCTVSRRRSNTPLQALAQLNDMVTLEASRALAARVVAEMGEQDAARVRHAFCLVLSRPPTATERNVLVDFLKRQRLRFAQGSLETEKLLGKTTSNATSRHALAALTTLARVLFNLDEAITKP